MLTRKQRWRRVRGGRFVEPVLASTGCVQPFASQSACPMGRPPHPIDSLSIGDSLLRLLGSSPAETDDGLDAPGSAAAAAATAVSPSRDVQIGKVRFNHQVRVVLVPSRTELEGLKEDLWWGEDDYFQFR